eukprot:gnl/TRDRNA2_/TRDRNA2_176448_c5_seq8.p1 gnl/TRDRNA2_/TRDRNA2_176448_c5~~gnl/TRDRNA2_/TRDRNA2_176448_c5_seq8.p1  ORF type:complete len:454 (+),score=36.56 gnl/TRDRNA2_/TRDRNA2_176448_c5_seq8:68-1363(+)
MTYIGTPSQRGLNTKKWANGGSYAVQQRPLWQKSLRCSGPTMEDCEECLGNQNCWGDCLAPLVRPGGTRRVHNGMERCVKVNSENKWTRFLNVVHVQCEQRTQFQIRPERIRGGVIKLHWHKLFKTFRKPLKNSEMVYRVKLRTEHKGGNTFAVEFAVNSNASLSKYKKVKALAKYVDLSFFMRTEFATCMDSKTCLDTIGDEAGLPLRESSGLLLQCLKSGMDKVAEDQEALKQKCKTWKNCLSQSDPSGTYETSLVTMLEAAGAGAPIPEHVSLKQQSAEAKCINPPTEDPMSWNCDCYEQMQQRCKDIGASTEMEMCLRAQFCEHTHTCQHWKDAACTQQTVKDMISRLHGASPPRDGRYPVSRLHGASPPRDGRYPVSRLHGASLQMHSMNNTSRFSALKSRAAPKEAQASLLAAEMDHSTKHKACA